MYLGRQVSIACTLKMKLYAKVKSERASKGQGGNEFLTVEIMAEGFEGIPTRANLYRLSLSKNDNYGGLYAELLKYSNHEIIVLDNIKGKKQKTAKELRGICNMCGLSRYVINDYECTKCQSTDVGLVD
jgi:hypothetical protein